MEVQEQQSRLLVNELHDRIGQNLTALNINLTLLQTRLKPDMHSQLQKNVDDSIHLVEETMASIRNIMSDLRPPALDDYGLLAAVRSLAKQFTNRTGIKTRVEGEDLHPRLPIVHELALYRICQEALTNIAKHANAAEVVITVQESNRKDLNDHLR